MRKRSSGISPVVATVILVAIAIVIAIAVAFWASGLVGVFTRFEKLEITAAYWDASNNRVVLYVKNTGSATTTIDSVYVNGIPGAPITYGGAPPGVTQVCGTTGGNATCSPGQGIVIYVTGTPAAVGGFQHGVTYEIAVHTASGKLYPQSVQIP